MGLEIKTEGPLIRLGFFLTLGRKGKCTGVGVDGRGKVRSVSTRVDPLDWGNLRAAA
jgi:hypothetical protein